MGIAEPLVNKLSFKSMRESPENTFFSPQRQGTIQLYSSLSHMRLVQGKHNALINLKLQHNPPDI